MGSEKSSQSVNVGGGVGGGENLKMSIEVFAQKFVEDLLDYSSIIHLIDGHQSSANLNFDPEIVETNHCVLPVSDNDSTSEQTSENSQDQDNFVSFKIMIKFITLRKQ